MLASPSECSQILWMFLPFATTAIIFVFVAIFCKWRRGIYAFLFASLAMFVSWPAMHADRPPLPVSPPCTCPVCWCDFRRH